MWLKKKWSIYICYSQCEFVLKCRFGPLTSFEVIITFCDLEYSKQSKFFSRKKKRSPLWINSILGWVRLLVYPATQCRIPFIIHLREWNLASTWTHPVVGELIRMFIAGQTKSLGIFFFILSCDWPSPHKCQLFTLFLLSGAT